MTTRQTPPEIGNRELSIALGCFDDSSIIVVALRGG